MGPDFEIVANDTGELLDTITPIDGRETYARAVHLAVSWSARTGRTVRVKGGNVHIAIAAWKLGTHGSCGVAPVIPRTEATALDGEYRCPVCGERSGDPFGKHAGNDDRVCPGVATFGVRVSVVIPREDA